MAAIGGDVRSRMQNLNLVDLPCDLSAASSLSEKDRGTGTTTGLHRRHQTAAAAQLTEHKLKKRKFKELDSAWDLSMDAQSQSLIAVQQVQQH